MIQSTCRVLLIGPSAHQAWDEIALDHPFFSGRFATDVDDACEMLRWLPGKPALVVIGQSFPGEVAPKELDPLRHFAPLARLVLLSESWCEGEMRNGCVPAGVIRVYRHQWIQRARRELSAIQLGLCQAWSLPATASAEEPYLVSSMPTATDSGRVAIVAQDSEAVETWAAACRSMGLTSMEPREWQKTMHVAADLVLWDTNARWIDDPARVKNLRERFGKADLVALWGFPRADEIERACRSGISAVISKPCLLTDLEWQLKRLIRASNNGLESCVEC